MEEEKKKRRFALGDLIVIAACILGLPLVMISLSMYGGLASPMWWTGLGVFILAAVLIYRRSLEKKMAEGTALVSPYTGDDSHADGIFPAQEDMPGFREKTLHVQRQAVRLH